MSQDIYEVYAVRYATRDGTRSANFIGGDPHDGPMPMDYFVWLVRNAERTFVVDVGFSEAMARQRKRTFLRTPSEGLALLGVQAATVKDVVITTCITITWARSSISRPRVSTFRTRR